MKISKERKSCAFVWEIRVTKTLCYKNTVQEYKYVFTDVNYSSIYETELEALNEIKEEFSYKIKKGLDDDCGDIKILESHIDFDNGICSYSYIHKDNKRQYPIHKVTLQVVKRRKKIIDMTVEEFIEYCSFHRIRKTKLKHIIEYDRTNNKTYN